MRLAIKIFVAQSLVILVVAGVAYWSITEIAKLRTADRQITTRTTSALRIEVSLRESMRRASALEERYVVFGDREYAEKPAAVAKEIQDGLAALPERLGTELERARLLAAGRHFATYREAAARGRAARATGDARRAGAIISSEAVPAAERFAEEMTRLIDLTQANLDFAQTTARTVVTEVQVAAERLEKRTWWAVVGGLVVAVLAALTGSAAIAVGLTRSLRRLRAGTAALAEGSFRELPVGSTDEIGDVTRAFNDMATRLRELDQMKEQFYASVSHELRSPLTSAREAAALLKDGAHGPLTPKQERLGSIIHSSTDRLLHLVNDTLDLSRASAGLLPLEPAPFDLAGAAAHAAEEMRFLAEQRGVVLKCEPGPGSFAIAGDERRIVQVLVNLLDNAIRFTPAGGTVTLRLVDAGDEVEAHVEDSGAGIPADQITSVFERYRQAHAGRGGSGLGLSIVRAMVEAHGGRVTASSREGEGSRFTVVLPRAPRVAASP